ncbi:MAG: membrane protein insertion efficiency factor YidD [Thermoleophilia bacterium]|nr:membrane protein insertion efficiency factor YidD [Thermoleophilia bacterium]
MRDLAIRFVRGYQRVVSPLFPRRCRYYPTCSEYAVESIRIFGVSRGFVLAGWRLLRCNPWSAGGVDHPADQTLFGSR